MINLDMINLLKRYLRMSQEELMKTLYEELHNYYTTIKIDPAESFIIAKGNLPIVLVAHMDVVFNSPRKIMAIYYDNEQNIMWSPDGLGTDDRAGVMMIMWMLKNTNYRPWILFTTNEESDLKGAQFASTLNIHPRFVIELDRQGQRESVFYKCDNSAFEEYINSFGFHTCRGTYTDISVLCPEWGCAGVNLSVGYYDEHTYAEYWSADDFLNTYNRLLNILEDCENAPKFKYIPKKEKKETNKWHAEQQQK